MKKYRRVCLILWILVMGVFFPLLMETDTHGTESQKESRRRRNKTTPIRLRRDKFLVSSKSIKWTFNLHFIL